MDEVEQLYIDPDECIDCGACEPECPVEAVFPEDDVPAKWKAYIEKNADWFRLSDESSKPSGAHPAARPHRPAAVRSACRAAAGVV